MNATPGPESIPQLKRSLSLSLLTFYGLGTILGAGIYVLVGEVVRVAGARAPLSFLVAGILAAFTALSYAELSARFPFSAGEPYYLQQGFGRRRLSALMGWLVVTIGLTSAATITNGFAGYLELFVALPHGLSISALILALGALAAFGITESVAVAALMTLMEIGGLLLVVIVGSDGLTTGFGSLPASFTVSDLSGAQTVLAGAFLAFYAYIGFEDMVNVAEEVKRPTRNLPLGIILALVTSTMLYLLVSLTAVMSLPIERVAGSTAPLAEIVRFHQPQLEPVIGIISMVAVINGALIQIIMASRVLYGMANQGMGPRVFARVHAYTRTPLIATVCCTVIVLILALGFGLVTLARLTSLITLIVFAGVNLALVRVKHRCTPPPGTLNLPRWAPLAGFVLCTAFLIQELLQI